MSGDNLIEILSSYSIFNYKKIIKSLYSLIAYVFFFFLLLLFIYLFKIFKTMYNVTVTLFDVFSLG